MFSKQSKKMLQRLIVSYKKSATKTQMNVIDNRPRCFYVIWVITIVMNAFIVRKIMINIYIMNVSFLIPVHPPHYPFLDFLHKLDDTVAQSGMVQDFDIFLILSYHSDLLELQKNNYKNCKTIVLEDYMIKSTIDTIINRNIIVTYKKFFALNIVKDKYKYCATVDSEIEFINIKNIYEKFQLFCDKKQIIGSIVAKDNSFEYQLIQQINVESASFFLQNHLHYKKLQELTYNFDFYSWFSDIPIYDMSYIDEFFDYIQFHHENFINKLSFYVFDYVSYVFYVLLFKNYSLLNVRNYDIQRNWSLECMPIQTYYTIKEKMNYHPLWLIQKAYNEKDENKENDIILIYHRDAGRNIIHD